MSPLQDWIDGGKCLLGFHQGEWRLTATERCELAQTCERCGHVSTRTEHAWGDWAFCAPSTCEQQRRCTRCPDAEERIAHEWRDWQYVERHRAPVRQCGRCAVRVSCFIEGALRETASDLPVATETPARPAPRRVRTRKPAPAAAASQPQPAPPTPVQLTADASAPEGARITPDLAGGLEVLRAEFERGIAAGEIPPDRQPRLRAVLEQLEGINAPGADRSLDDLRISNAQNQRLVEQMGALLMSPSCRGASPGPPPGSRLASLTTQFEALYQYVTGELSRLNLNTDEGRAAGSLLGSLKTCRDGLLGPDVDANPVGLEAQSLRQAAMDIRAFSLRQHLTVVRPRWPSQRIPQNPNAVFYSGGEVVRDLVVRTCERKRLKPLLPQPHFEPASLRWDQLRESAVAIFDFTTYAPSLPLDEAARVAAVAYELGLALTLGRPVMLMAHRGQTLPFDLDLEPARIEPGDTDVSAIAAGLDLLMYGLQRGTAGQSASSAARYLRQLYSTHTDFNVRLSLESLTDEATRDPVRAALLMSSSLMFMGGDAPSLVYPAWPGAYPDRAAPLCFHVTPFGPAWAAETKQIVEEACRAQHVEYARGDLRPEQDIMRSIWNDLCRATHVLVDLTGLNANVALELGMAHTLGRHVRLITQDEHPEQVFTAIAKQRMHRYALRAASGAPPLASTLEGFLEETMY